MLNRESIASYLENLFYSFSKPDMATVIASSIDSESPSAADSNTQFLRLGALLATKKFREFSLLSQKLDFSHATPEERAYFACCLFTFISPMLLANYGNSSEHAAAVLQLLTVISPDTVLAHKINCERSGKSALIELNYAKSIDTSISGAVFARDTQFGPNSRKNEFGHRIQSSLASQGWHVSLLPLQELSCFSSPYQQDFILLDLNAFSPLPHMELIHSFLLNLKRYFRKIILIELDPWTGIHDDMLREISDYVDYIWGFTPDWRLMEEPCYREKGILFPNVGGFDHLPQSNLQNLDRNSCSFNFTGSVQGYNLNRAYWILESIHLNLPIDIKITQPHIDDGLSCEDSLLLYAKQLLSTHASLNLATRKDGSRMLTGRAVEVISLNRLLIQEACPALRRYYIEGDHYLEFTDIEGLCSIIEFLGAHPKVAQNISNQGYQFYHERYSSRKMVEHIQTLL